MTTTKFRTLHLLRGLAACAALLVGGGLSATAVPVESTAAPETFTYIVVLHDRAPKDGPNDRTEPDIPAMGGKVVEKLHNRRVIRISEAGVRALAAHRGVKYIQRVQTDGSLPPVPRATALATVSDATTSGVRADWTPPTWSSGNYVYDGEGNITAIGPGSDGGTDSYVYDSAGRLVSAETNHGQEHSEQYSYDSYGNLVHTGRTAGPATDTPVDGSNRLEGVEYDEAGNVVHDWPTDYAYDGMNMLRAKWDYNGLVLYLYTADDERIGVETGGDQRWMIRDLSGRVLREWRGWGGYTWLWVEDYIHRGTALAAAEREPAEGGTRHFHLDHLGTPRLITDSAGVKIALHDYFPFGVEQTDFRQEMFERGTDRPEPMKFTGHERDFNGGVEIDNRNQLDYMHARYYDPVKGRFLSVDPVLDLKRNLHAPQNWNRYSYTANNPISRVDPDGRAWDWIPDAAGLAYDAYQMWKEPSWANAGWLAADVVLGVVPFVPNRGAVKLAEEGGTALVRRSGSVVVEGKALQKELDFAAEMSAKGNNVVVRGTGAQGGDLLINGTMFELKTLQAATQNAVEKNIIRGLEQGAGRVIIDGRAAGLSHGNAIRAIQKLQRQGKLKNAEEIRVYSATGEFRYTP